MQNALRPSRLLIFNTLIIIGGCIFVFSFGLALVTVPDPCSMVAGTFYKLPFFWIGTASYRAVFRENARSARNTGILLYFLCAMILFGVALTSVVWINNSPFWNTAYYLILCGIAFLGIYLLICGRQQRRWAKTIEAWRNEPSLASDNATAEQRTPQNSGLTPPFQFSLRELLGLVTVVGLIASITTWMIRSEPPRFIEHATPREAGISLPQGASNVCCARGFRGTITYEFTIDEKGFFEWANSGLGSLESRAAGIPIKPIDAPFSFFRYTNWKPDNALTGEDNVTITNGYYYSWSKEDRWVIFAYDKDNHRAYYHFSSH